MAVKMSDFQIRKKQVSLNKLKKNSTQHPVCLQKLPIFAWYFASDFPCDIFQFFGYAHRETTLILAW